jgi:hypothetical protein
VQNFPVLPAAVSPTPKTYKYNFDLGLLGYVAGENVSSLTVSMIQDGTMYNSLPPTTDFTEMPVNDISYDYEGRPGGPHSNLTYPGIDDPTGYFSLVFPIRYERRTNMPNVECGEDECGPAAAANSFAWMAEEYGYDTLPGVAELLDSLKNLQHMETNTAVDGTEDPEFLKGKLRLINEFDLPIEVHFQGGYGLGDSSYTTDDGTAEFQGERPTFERIEQQDDMGQDVELGISWFDSTGSIDGGHWIVLEGKVDYGLGGPRGFYYRHDTEQDSAGGAECTHFSWLTMNDDSLLELAGEPDNQIDFAVAESPTDQSFIPGDADGNGLVNISDAVFLISYIFGGGTAPEPIELGDADCNGLVNISDAVYLISYIFGGGPEPCNCNEGAVRLGPFCVNNATKAAKSGVTITLAGTGGSLHKPVVVSKPAGCGEATVSAAANTVTIEFDTNCIPPNGEICFTVCSEHEPLQVAGAEWF